MNGFELILPFLKPIEHLILDDSISEIVVNGANRVFVEKAARPRALRAPHSRKSASRARARDNGHKRDSSTSCSRLLRP
jgi:Flp pilus assembly CpaF family ATPase